MFFGEFRNVNAKWHITCAKDIDDTVILKSTIKAQFLQQTSVTSCSYMSLKMIQ